ncbi:GNAT family N-acetyltransferase [Lentibacillus cibarius]|uniref:GNAT family N-acetyltransferase n=1 Tax=Lentibacillus cibarius TaxID=2583219 RepID=A0A549YJY4_9BACI|nr:GNAT family N-acetyltransferase [Lentibacillus cibarius]TRM12182.1 GNAT family N-acetyltransferase [Lentibacillus cibarius]
MGIRKAGPDDLKMIYEHAHNVRNEAVSGGISPDEVEPVTPSDIIDGGGHYLVFDDEQGMKGWIGVGRIINHKAGRMTGIIPEVFVFPLYRSQGIGRQLCEAACRQLKREGCKKVQLNVFKGNHAKELYEKLGFYEVSSLMEKHL